MSSYLLGMSAPEIARLERQHDVWRSHTTRIWSLAGFGVGQTLVDLGCGPGFTSLELAAIVGPSGRVIAVDASVTAIDHLRVEAARRQVTNIEAVPADVNSVDVSRWKPHGVFARWLFSFLANPEGVVRHIAEVLPPGATAVVMDYWNYLAIQTEPAAPIFREVFQAVHESFARAGGSLDVAGQIPAFFNASGLTVTATEPCAQTGRPGSPVWRWLDEFQKLYLPTLVEKSLLTRAELDEYERWWAEQSNNPNALFFTPPILAVIGVKA